MLLVLVGHMHSSLITWPDPLLDHLYDFLQGTSGVDMFFTISGFVITRGLHPKLLACQNLRSFLYTSLAFWIRRLWRITPSAWFWLAFTLLATVTFNRSGAFHSFNSALSGTIAAIFQVHNYWMTKCFGHYDCGANFYYWTLSLEEQFYLLLPFSIFIFRRWLPHILICLIVFQIFYPNRSALMVAFRTDALLLGVLIALWTKSTSYHSFQSKFLGPLTWGRHMIVFSLLAAMATDRLIYDGILAAFGFGVIAIICATLVLIGSYDKAYLMPTGVPKNLLIWLGSRSCSIYLAHIPALLLTKEIWYRVTPAGTVFDSHFTVPFILSGISIVFILSEFSYRLLESPSQRKGTETSIRFTQKHERLL